MLRSSVCRQARPLVTGATGGIGTGSGEAAGERRLAGVPHL
ncbi:hypothetical protein [Paenibacillus spongiae]|nr:hypothetical protein [Paenibacillus spongiae]